MARSITLRLSIEPGEDVRTPDKRSLRDADWTIRLIDSDRYNDTSYNEKAIGYLSHYDEHQSDLSYRPETCAFEIAIGSAYFDTLLSTLQAGRLPDWLALHVRGIGYSWEPDGSGKEWNVKEGQQLAVSEVSVRLPMVSIPQPQTTDEDDDDATNRLMPISALGLKQTEVAIVEALRTEARESRKYLIAAVAMLALALLALWK